MSAKIETNPQLADLHSQLAKIIVSPELQAPSHPDDETERLTFNRKIVTRNLNDIFLK